MWFIRLILLPFSMIYGIITYIRNKLFDWRILPSEKFDFPVISVGNLTVGGTGKTPHIEYLVRLLKDQYPVIVLSRGYGRKSRGYQLGSQESTEKQVGDESMQYISKFRDIKVVVDESRLRGIKTTEKKFPGKKIYLLDDAFQHRYVKPGLSILLTDYHKLYPDDYPLPSGSLREFRSGASRADMIVITKSPKIFSPILRRELVKKISPKPHQRIFYSYISYEEALPLKITGITEAAHEKYSYIILLTGIANNYPMQEYLTTQCNELIMMDYPDHHNYTQNDLKKILDTYHNIISKDKVIFTTEKDAMRLESVEFSSFLEGVPVYYLPIRIKFHHCDDLRFDKMVLNYVEKNFGNS